MNDFQFRLETLLELRSDAETEAAGKLAAAQADAKEAELSHGELEQARRETHAELTHLQDQGIGVGRLQSIRIVLERLEQSIQYAAELLNGARELVSERREDYHRANRERRALEELKLKRRDAWSRETARRDQRAMDEIATTRYLNGGPSLSHGRKA